jgi:hypothetical protein
MFWEADPLIDELRKRNGWADFHREAGQRGFYFDPAPKEGRRYKWVAFTMSKASKRDFYRTYHLADGVGATPFEAIEACYRNTGRCDAELDALIERIRGDAVAGKKAPPVEAIKPPVGTAETDEKDEFDALFEDEPEAAAVEDEFEDLFS